MNNSTLEAVYSYTIEHQKLLSSCQAVDDKLRFSVYPDIVELTCYDYNKKAMEDISKVGFEGSQVLLAHMKESLVVMTTNTGYLVLIIFKPHRHYLVTAKLPDGITVKILEVLGSSNHIFYHDSEGRSLLISIKKTYSKLTNLDFSIASKEDYFEVQKLVFEQEVPKKVRFTSVIPGSAQTSGGIVRYILDIEGNIYTIKLPDTTDATVAANDLENYLRSHHFEYKNIYLPSSRCEPLEVMMRSVSKKLEVPWFPMYTSDPFFTLFLPNPPATPNNPSVLSLYLTPEPQIRQDSLPKPHKPTSPLVDIKLAVYQDQFNDNQNDNDESKDDKYNNTEQDKDARESRDGMLSDGQVRGFVSPKKQKQMDKRYDSLTHELHNLVRAVDRISDNSKRNVQRKTGSLGARILIRSKIGVPDGKNRQSKTIRGATQGSGSDGLVNKSMIVNARNIDEKSRRRSVSKNKSFRITNKSLVN